DLEREKGITILAKNTAVMYKDTKINIIDTPGHADFSGEVERVINMADGAILVVDAAEGPLPQTQFVLQKALEQNLKTIVVVNKIDRKDARPKEVLRETEELFLRLATSDEHLNFSVLYAVGREGKAWKNYPFDMKKPGDLTPLFEEIIAFIPPPQADIGKPFKMLISQLDFDSYKGTYAIGKVSQGILKAGQTVLQLKENEKMGTGKIQQIFTSIGLSRVEAAASQPGDIIAVTGLGNLDIGQTLADPADPAGYPVIKLGEPTLKIRVSANTSPLAGKEGKFCTAKQLEERLWKEKKTNIGLKIEENKDGHGFIICGRGELHLSILLENLRREGYEMEAGKPEVILKKIDGVLNEPFEELTIEINKEYIGVVTQELGKRGAQLLDTHTDDNGVTRMVYKISERNLLGLRSDLLTQTRGNGLFATRLLGYFPALPETDKLRNGALISFETGVASAYALTTLQQRGTPFIGPATPVYEGMIVGLNRKQEDMDINVCKTKKLTNIHSENSDVAIALEPPVILTLEQSLDFLAQDELLEITPQSLRLRKKYLTKVDRIRAARVKTASM
ncbi:MAG: GTP-binding protein, partial [Patescibacteria group bacterium]|nr:GTP-binding protein [Patescibacteria group bacterium]